MIVAAALLRFQPRNLVEFRNKLACCTLCIGCMRPGDGARSTACNLKFDADYLKGLLDFKDCSTLVINNRKQDQESKGHWMRFGKSSTSTTSSGCSWTLLGPDHPQPAPATASAASDASCAALPEARKGPW